MKTQVLIFMLLLAGWLGQLRGQIIDNLKPTKEQIAAFDRAAQEWSYVFEAQSIGYLHNQQEYEAFVVMQQFRGNGLPDTLYLQDLIPKEDLSFGCGGPVAEDRARSGLFIVKSFTEKLIQLKSGKVQAIPAVEKQHFYCMRYYMEEWPQDAKHQAVQNWNRSFRTYTQFYEWLYQLPQIKPLPLGSWQRPTPNNQVSGFQLVDVVHNITSNRKVTFEERIAISDSVFLHWDSILQNYYKVEYLNKTYRKEMFYEQSSRLWPEVFPPKWPVQKQHTTQERDSIIEERIMKIRNEEKRKYDELIKKYPKDSVKLREMYLNDSVRYKRQYRKHGDTGVVKKNANSIVRLYFSEASLRYDTDFNQGFYEFTIGIRIPVDRFIYRFYFNMSYNSSVFGSHIVDSNRVFIHPLDSIINKYCNNCVLLSDIYSNEFSFQYNIQDDTIQGRPLFNGGSINKSFRISLRIPNPSVCDSLLNLQIILPGLCFPT